MKSAKIIIGANYGDEAKGLFTDFLCSRTRGGTIVIRFNGGAQAAHTVKLKDGRRHVFNHIGSGSFTGAATYLSRFFVCNPILFAREWSALSELGVMPDVFVDPLSLVSTPYDMMINHLAEQARGINRHGSCGLGFGETIERNLTQDYAITVADLLDTRTLQQKLDLIRFNWMPRRLAELGVINVESEWIERRLSNDLRNRYVKTVEFFLECTSLRTAEAISLYPNLVFEGAQGLLLDQDNGSFPHVTRSNTGLKNVIALAHDMGLEHLDVHYVTRAYMTRHGAGPLAWELPEKPYAAIIDHTNVPNPHQGSLRFAWLDIDRLTDTIVDDLRQVPSDISTSPSLMVSCLDQVGSTVTYVQNGQVTTTDTALFIARLQTATCASRMYISRGPTRATVQFDHADSTSTEYLRSLKTCQMQIAHV